MLPIISPVLTWDRKPASLRGSPDPIPGSQEDERPSSVFPCLHCKAEESLGCEAPALSTRGALHPPQSLTPLGARGWAFYFPLSQTMKPKLKEAEKLT